MRFGVIALFVIGALGASHLSAQAQATRTWVSGVGDDANPCSRTAPCKTFAGAISKTAAGGEINALDSGGFGALTITKSISIIANGILAGVLVSGTNGITVNAGQGDNVLLDGLDFEGLGSGLTGVQVNSANRVVVRNSTIQGFTSNGISLVSSVPNSSLLVEKSLILGNGGGVFVQGSGVSTFSVVQTSTIGGNSQFNLSVNGPSAVSLSASSLLGPAPSIVTTSGGSVVSYGNNVIKGSTTPTQTLLLQ